MKKSSEALKQEISINSEATEKKSVHNEKNERAKLHIQKVEPIKSTSVAADPGGCRPSGT